MAWAEQRGQTRNHPFGYFLISVAGICPRKSPFLRVAHGPATEHRVDRIGGGSTHFGKRTRVSRWHLSGAQAAGPGPKRGSCRTSFQETAPRTRAPALYNR